MGEACSIYIEGKCVESFGGETLEKRTTWKTYAWMGG